MENKMVQQRKIERKFKKPIGELEKQLEQIKKEGPYQAYEDIQSRIDE